MNPAHGSARVARGNRISTRLGWMAILGILVTIVVLSGVMVQNLDTIERQKERDYLESARKIGQIVQNFILRKEYDSLWDVMKLQTQTSNILYVDYSIGGGSGVHAGDPKVLQTRGAGFDSASGPSLQRKAGRIYIRVPLQMQPGVPAAMRMVFDDRDFQTSKQRVYWALGMNGTLLISLMVLLRFLAKKNRILQEMQEKLEEAEKTKSEMIRALSHHAMQFITTIYGKLFYLLEQQRAMVPALMLSRELRIVRENMDAVQRILVNLKENERLSKGLVKNIPKKISVKKLIRTARVGFAESLRQRRMRVTISAPVKAVYAWADKEIVRTVITNVLDNAIKYSMTGAVISIRIRWRGPMITTYIEDQGKGIPPEDWQRIFIPYVRLDPGVQGTGLGLSNSRRLIQLVGGELGIHRTRLGRGTVFYFSLPKWRKGISKMQGSHGHAKNISRRR